MTTEPLPSYDDLPIDATMPPGSSWGVWGPDDRFGCLNLLTPERVLAAIEYVKTGESFPLNWSLDLPDPPLFGRTMPTHTLQWMTDAQTFQDDVLSNWNTQSSSQWDGFRHLRHSKFGFYNGLAGEEHGIHHWAERGIVGRSVLVDMERWRANQGRPLKMDQPDPITPDEICDALTDQRSEIRTGDVLLVRTGWMRWYLGLDTKHRGELEPFVCPGLRPGRATVQFLWDLHLAAVAADNPALEVGGFRNIASEEELRIIAEDPESVEVSAHRGLLPLLGMPIGEMFDLDRLADACAADGRYEGLFMSAPLNVRGGIASPPNAIVLR